MSVINAYRCTAFSEHLMTSTVTSRGFKGWKATFVPLHHDIFNIVLWST